jgi:hypothetical protein
MELSDSLIKTIVEISSIHILRKKDVSYERLYRVLAEMDPSSKRVIGTLSLLRHTLDGICPQMNHLTLDTLEKYGEEVVILCESWEGEEGIRLVREMIKMDRVDLLDATDSTAEAVVERCNHLISNHRDVWGVAKRLYNVYFNSIYNNLDTHCIDTEILRRCLSIFPRDSLSTLLSKYGDDFRVGLVDLSNLHSNIAPPKDDRAYPLPSQERIRRLNDGYLSLFVEECEMIHQRVTVMNTNTYSGIDVNTLPPSQIKRVCDENGGIWQLTLSEYKLDVNPHTGRPLKTSKLQYPGRVSGTQTDDVGHLHGSYNTIQDKLLHPTDKIWMDTPDSEWLVKEKDNGSSLTLYTPEKNERTTNSHRRSDIDDEQIQDLANVMANVLSGVMKAVSRMDNKW